MPQTTRARDPAVAVFAVATILFGCGGDSGSSAPPSAAQQPAPLPAPLPAPSEPLPVSACPAGIATGDIIPSGSAAPICDSTQFDLHSDLAYASHGDALLDLLVPRNANAPTPLVVWVHGGGWQSGDKSDRAQAQRLVCRGFALAAINYRLSDTAPFPAQIQDVKAAIRFLRANAATYGLDPGRIAVFGSSAGGHLAALAGTGGEVAGLDDPTLGNATVSSRVQAVIDWYGPTRFVEMDAQALAQGCPVGSARHSTADSAESRLLGCTLGDVACAAAAQRADPSSYADSADPPHLILHGTADCVSPAAQSAVLAQALTSTGACAVHRRVPGAGHGGASWTTPEVQDAVAEFLQQTLARSLPSPVAVDCAAFRVAGDAAGMNGATWNYRSTDQGIEYNLTGVLFTPAGSGPHSAVLVSHGLGGSANSYSAGIARTMRDWGMVAIATNYTHAIDAVAAGLLPPGDAGASAANVQRSHKTRDLLSCVAGVDLSRLAAHGHSMGAFVTGQLLGSYPADFRAASHTAGGANESGPNATRSAVAASIRTPYQLHHGDADVVVDVALDEALQRILAANGTAHELHVYAGYSHAQIAFDAGMLERVRAWYRAHGVL